MAIDVIRSKIVIASLSYVQPVFTADYLQIRVVAEVTMPDVLNVDIVTPVDLVSLSTTKTFSDTTNGFTDRLVGIVFGKGLADTPILSDLAVIGDIQPHIDSIDTATPADAVIGFTFAKYIADTFALLDEATAVRLFERSFTDSLSVPDVPYKDITPEGQTDLATTSDSSSLGTDKALSDAFGMIDNMDGDIEYLLFKVTSESISSSDAQIIDFNPQKADNIATDSSGILSMQDYCDITYFLEDYVGLSRTFT
jgi:hypothetical protein